MKVKVKLDLASIKSWLLAHGEKVALGVVAIVFLLFVYSAMQRETLEDSYAPQKLGELATAVGDHVQKSTWDPAREAVKIVDYGERAKVKAIPVGTYALPRAFNGPVTDPKAKRGQPEIFPAEELRVASGMDIFRISAKQASGAAGSNQDGSDIKAQPWVVVTGLVPVERESQAYANTFLEAHEFSSKRDVPNYLAPILERAEINVAKPDELTWTKVPNAVPANNSGLKNDIVPSKYLVPTLTAPLNDLAAGQWGESVSHPKIPLTSDVGNAEPAPAAPSGRDDLDGPEARKPQSPAAPSSDAIKYYLLRCFDYNVQPGKRYRYRVTLVLANPNAGVAPMYLEDPESSQASTLDSKPTDPTAVITVPDGHDVLAGPIDAGSLYREPSAMIMVTAIDMKSGLKAATEVEARRGFVANLPPHEVTVPHPVNKTAEKVTVGFKSDFMVLDIYGGNILGRRRETPITAPGEILFLDASGNMTVRSEIDDHEQFQKSIVRDEPAPAKQDEEPERIKPRERDR